MLIPINFKFKNKMASVVPVNGRNSVSIASQSSVCHTFALRQFLSNFDNSITKTIDYIYRSVIFYQ